jgi:hypothetical protein
MQQIKFTHTGHSAAFGSFQAGDLLRCSAAAARHFVVDAGCAEYVGQKPLQASAPVPTPGAPAPAAKRAVARKEAK